VLVVRGAFAQAQPDVAEVLKKVSETYKGVSEYELVAEATMTEGGTSTRAHMRVAFRAPDRYRMEATIPGLEPTDSRLDEAVTIHDGSALWFYLPKSNQYGSIPADELAADPEGSAHTPEATDEVMMGLYRRAADLADGAKLLREEAIDVAGVAVPCYVASVMDRTWWVDKKTNRVVREDRGGSSTVFTLIRLGEPLPDSLFKFVPPPGARKVEFQQ